MNDPQQDPTDEELDAAQGASAAPAGDAPVVIASADTPEDIHRLTDQGGS